MQICLESVLHLLPTQCRQSCTSAGWGATRGVAGICHSTFSYLPNLETSPIAQNQKIPPRYRTWFHTTSHARVSACLHVCDPLQMRVQTPMRMEILCNVPHLYCVPINTPLDCPPLDIASRVSVIFPGLVRHTKRRKPKYVAISTHLTTMIPVPQHCR